MVLEMFGQAEGYDLEDPYNYEQNETIHDALMFLENEINECLNELLPSKGMYYVGYYDADGSYCLFLRRGERRMYVSIGALNVVRQDILSCIGLAKVKMMGCTLV